MRAVRLYWSAHVPVATCIIGKAYHTEPMERADQMQWWRSRLGRETFYTTTGLDKATQWVREGGGWSPCTLPSPIDCAAGPEALAAGDARGRSQRP
jgi:hypothetical protein